MKGSLNSPAQVTGAHQCWAVTSAVILCVHDIPGAGTGVFKVILYIIAQNSRSLGNVCMSVHRRLAGWRTNGTLILDKAAVSTGRVEPGHHRGGAEAVCTAGEGCVLVAHTSGLQG